MEERRTTNDERRADEDSSFVLTAPAATAGGCRCRLWSTLVLGLGNPILGDDGVGWLVVEVAQEAWRRRTDGRRTTNDEPISSSVIRPLSSVEFDYVSLGGLALMERLVGCDRAILVDAIQTRDGVPGAIYRLTLDDLPTLHADAIHDASLKAALAVGQQLGARLPQEIVVIGIEAVNLWDFSESLSPQVAASVARAAEMVLDELADGEWPIANSKRLIGDREG